MIPDNPALFGIGIPEEERSVREPGRAGRHHEGARRFPEEIWPFLAGLQWHAGRTSGAPATRLILNVYAPRWKAEQMADGIEKRLQELNAQGHTAISTKARLNEIGAYNCWSSAAN